MTSRQNLPYRETSDCFLLYKGKLVAKVNINSNIVKCQTLQGKYTRS